MQDTFILFIYLNLIIILNMSESQRQWGEAWNISTSPFIYKKKLLWNFYKVSFMKRSITTAHVFVKIINFLLMNLEKQRIYFSD